VRVRIPPRAAAGAADLVGVVDVPVGVPGVVVGGDFGLDSVVLRHADHFVAVGNCNYSSGDFGFD